MKKLILGIFVLAICFSCSNDEIDSETIITNVDITTEAIIAQQASTAINGEYKGAINPVTLTPQSRFNTNAKGMYHGIIVSSDTEIHGKIWINLENDGKYNAIVVTNTDDKLSFFGNMGRALSKNSFSEITFVGERGSFVYDVSDYNNPIATAVVIDGKEGYIETVKDRSDQRADVALGTYVDTDDATFAGTWDLMTDGTLDPIIGLPILTQTCTVGPTGAMFTDMTMEPFDWSCFVGSVQTFTPIFARFGDPNNPLSGNEFWAQGQTLAIGDTNASYSIGVSTMVSDANGETVGLFNVDLTGANPAIGCYVSFGVQGVWEWNGRSGTIAFDDDAFMVPPTRSIETIQGFKKALQGYK
ncbi:hypothetical protein [uncultured Dokdonia sp.]|uniref:hypothetical protein n=1 Tax=uncultured Dokdonia sp. TaxID=575653 RepID=UPI0026107E03|nr:hypothetical protein [uncultured Dokdonia sp.]